MIFRNAQINDLPIIVEIYNSTIASRMVTADTEPVTVDNKAPWFYSHNEKTRPLWVVENDAKEMIGWVSFSDFYGRPAYDGTAEISIYLNEKMRGQGYGKKILQYCITNASALKIQTLLGYIFSHNQPSLQLFKQAGFEEWGNLKDIANLDEQTYSLKIVGRKVN